MKRALLVAWWIAAPSWSARLVSVGTSVTDTIAALGAGSELVGVDGASKSYIPEAAQVPDIGTFRSISVEGIISLKPTQVFLAYDAGPPTAISQMQQAGVTVVVVPRDQTLDEVRTTIRFLADKLNRKKRGDELIESLNRDMQAVAELLKQHPVKPKVLFCSLGPNAPTGSISGRATRIDEIIRLAGAANPIQSFEGMRPMTEEGVIAASPDIILITERAFERAGGVEGVRKLPGISLTPAGKAGRVFAVSDIYFQGFGPGIGKAVLALAKRFHQEH